MPYICWWYLLVHKIVDLRCNKYLWFSFHPNNENLNMKVVGTSYFQTLEGCKSSRNESDSITDMNTLILNYLLKIAGCISLWEIFFTPGNWILSGRQYSEETNCQFREARSHECEHLERILSGELRERYSEHETKNILKISYTTHSQIHFKSI